MSYLLNSRSFKVIRSFIFWSHLVVGLAMGIIVAVMSLTGVLIAFEEEILAWLDRDIRRLSVEEGSAHRSITEVLEALPKESEGQGLSGLTFYADANASWVARYGRNQAIYVNPYSGEWSPMPSDRAHHWFHVLTDWHRWLGAEGAGRATGRAITGACNLGFLFLLLSGLFLWVPRKWTRRAFIAITIVKAGAKGKARDWNWHHAFGLWSTPVLLVLVATGVVISYPWAGNLVYRLAGEEPPPPRRGPPGMMAATPIAPPAGQTAALDWEVQLQQVQSAFPDWREITLRVSGSVTPQAETATMFSLRNHRERPRFASTQVMLDPCRGEILSQSGYRDMSSGRKARMWMRYLHTGEAFGFWGKLIAALASGVALILVWTGFALSWRRFMRGSRNKGKKPLLKV